MCPRSAPNRTRFDLGLGANQFACIFLAANVSPTPRNLPVTGCFLQSGGTWRRSAHLLIKLFSKSILSTAQLRNGKVPEPCAFLSDGGGQAAIFAKDEVLRFASDFQPGIFFHLCPEIF